MPTPSILLDPAFRQDTTVKDESFVKRKSELPKAEQNEALSKWPRQLVLDDDTRDRLVQYLDFELDQCFAERQLLVNDWSQWQTDYWAKPESAEKNFPFRRAANVVIPMTAIAVEAVHARLMNTLFSVEPFYTVTPRTKDWVEVAPVVEEWLQTEVEGPLDMYSFCTESLMEVCKLGTGVGKTGYSREVRKSMTEINGKEVESFVTIKDGACLDYVPLANFTIRIHEKDPQEAMWCGEEHVFTWVQLKRMALSGRITSQAVEDVRAWWVTRYEQPSAAGQYDQVMDTLADQAPAWHEVFKINEMWVSFDVDGDGIDEEIVVDFHKMSLTIMSVRYNWYDDLHRPYRHGVYVPVEGRFYGIGIGKQNEQFQKIITTIHRQRLDNQTLANMMQLALKKTSGYGPGEPLHPGKMWFLDNPKEDIVPLKVSDTYTTQIAHEDYTRSYSERRTGVNEVILGMPHEGTPGTATSDMARLAEGNKKFDMVLKNVRRWLSKLGVDLVANYQQFGDNDRHWIRMDEAGGEVIEQVLSLPPQLVRDGAIIDVTVTDSISNKEIQRQQWMSLFAVLSQYYDKQMANAAQLGNQELFIMMGMASLEAGDYLIRRLVETFREARVDPQQLLLYPKLSELMNERLQQGIIAGGAGAGQAPGMAGLPPAGGAGNGGAGAGAPKRNRQGQGMGANQAGAGAPMGL